jgi:PAS domain S-box-containing protein
MNRLHDLTFKRKLSVLTLLTTTGALILAGLVLVGFEVPTFKGAMVTDVSAQAKILANLSTASLSFNDPPVAEEMLRELRHEPYIVASGLFDAQGNPFAAYQRDTNRPYALPARAPAAEGEEFSGDHLALHRTVVFKGQQIGTVLIVSDMRQLWARIAQYLGIVLGVLCASSLLALWMSSKLQRFISAPLLQLCATARQIAERRDFTLRARKFGGDEIGVFTDAFNQMLAQIQSQDAALKRSQYQLDALVHSIDGIVWECTPDTLQFTFVSRQSERILGFTPDQWMARPRFWEEQLHPGDAAQTLQACLEAVARREPYHYDYRMIAADGRTVWIRESGVVLVEDEKPVAVRGIFQEITAQKLASEELARLNRELVDTSRKAGMAEVATGVLHNVGNVLNSVNVSCSLVLERVQQSEVATLPKLAELIEAQRGRLDEFLTRDPQGRQIPDFLCSLAPVLAQEQSLALKELNLLRDKIDHIKEIVAMQQSYAGAGGVLERVAVADLIEDAIKLNSGALAGPGVRVERQFDSVPLVTTDKHKVLQIVLNLVRNAKYACDESPIEPKVVLARVSSPRPNWVRIQVIDNGVGIPAENLTKIFGHGFTTRHDGHGFGLHSGALAARQLGGSLSAQSDGVGTGATFALELPVEHDRASDPAASESARALGGSNA